MPALPLLTILPRSAAWSPPLPATSAEATTTHEAEAEAGADERAPPRTRASPGRPTA